MKSTPYQIRMRVYWYVNDLRVLFHASECFHDFCVLFYHFEQEENDRMSKAIDELAKKNKIFAKRLRDHGIDDSIVTHENVHDIAHIQHKQHIVYQGLFLLFIHVF